ncbi:MAG: FtsX-like permease family protein [Anaerolineae bacterium]|jgi:putative ABC transport system permease protein|nr:FtsX-like permease family protein [Anaerolineae bacterium]
MIIKRFYSLMQIVIKRMTTQPGLVAAKTLGLFVGMMMMLSIPLYADAVNYQIFSETTLESLDYPGVPPLSILIHYVGQWKGEVNFEDIVPIDEYITTDYVKQVRLPLESQVMNVRTDNFQIFPTGASGSDAGQGIKYVALNYVSDFQDHVTLVQGSFDGWSDGLVNGRVPVMIHEQTANETGIRLGEEFTYLVRWRDDSMEQYRQQIPIVVTGIYTQTDPEEDYWYFASTSTLSERFFISRHNYANTVAGLIPIEVYSVSWFQIYDSNHIHFDQTQGISKRIENANLEAQLLLYGTDVPISPLEPLNDYADQSRTLTLYLFIISAPIIILILFFIGMVSKIEVDSRLNEIAILRSRGATRMQIVFIEAVEALVLGVIAVLLAIPASLGVTHLISQTRSFLDFSLIGESLRVQVNNPMWYTAGLMVLVTILTQVIPTLSASQHTVQSYKRQQARLIQKPWWQRFFLDFILMGVVIFGIYFMQDLEQTGFYDNVGENSIVFSITYLLPILLAVAVSLLFLRLMPFLLSLLTWIMGKTKNINFLMAARTLHRMPNAYQMPLMLLIITVNIAVFTTTLATTVDQHLYDQIIYRVGSEMRFVDYGENRLQGSTTTSSSSSNSFDAIFGSQEETTKIKYQGTWTFLPVEYYLEMPGVNAVSRLGEYTMKPGFINGQEGIYYGIDRLGFSQAAFWRSDFSEDSFGELMNQLALHPEGILVSRDFAERYVLKYGDLVPVQIYAFGDEIAIELLVVGIFDYFPTWYPEENDQLIVGNLDYLFNVGSGPYPYSVLIQTQAGVDSQETEDAITDTSTVDWFSGGRASEIIEKYQKEPTRQGFFGMLTISFIITALLSFLGFFLYAVFSMRRRLIELGVLRAIGLSTRQMAATLAWEFVSLIFGGALIGTFVGLFSSRTFVPYMQINTEQISQTPPYFINIAWAEIFQLYGLLLFLFLLLVVALVSFLRRIKIFEAIKLGETV